MTVQATPVEAPYPPIRYAWYVIGVLFVATLLSQLDRQLPALLVRPIRAEFGISDTAFSFLQGYAFALFYTFAGLPFGWLIDRTVRRNLIVVGMVLWSVMTVLSGFAQSYEQLVMTRMGVGIGEAVLAPAAYSIIADYVAPHRRGRAFSVYYLALAIGSGASLILGALIARIIPDVGLSLPGVGLMSQWRLTFLIAGAPGLFLALLLFTIREPVRRDAAAALLSKAGASWGDFLGHLKRHFSTFSRVLTYPGVVAVVGYGNLAWAPTFFDRRFDIPTQTSGIIIGVLVAVGGLTGTLVSGWISDRWAAKGVPAARLRVAMLAWLLVLPTVCVWSLVPIPWLSFALLTVVITGFGMAQAAAPTAVQEITPNRMRGKAVAVYLLIGGLVGIGFGPMSIALVTDHVFKDDSALPYALAIVGGPISLLGLWLTWSGLKPYQRTVEALRAQAAQPS
ncbi:MFS transporter [Brevundimonas sp.]|uniref:spinster family MFS transporter n=1 Tax=Brevundimonas sp. TaxID=1871086 RepID=UPI001A2BB272|nr:MFS transporter [Brevundimonas sp.]MBJ7483293.1 MFS transporter [Brevundimonas sp.]